MEIKFVPGGPNPTGRCFCGCGRKTKPASTSARGYKKGQYQRYLFNHAAHQLIRDRNIWDDRLWTVEDRGYQTPCFVWKGHKDKKWGYGKVFWQNRERPAHVRAWIEDGRTLLPGFQLDHLCRVRDCVNVEHLEQVTPAVNVRRSRSAKLTDEKVAEIRALYTGAYGDTSEIARKFGITRGNVRFIVQGKTWKPD